MKKVVVLNGSPRIKGNTSMLVESFKKGAEENGNEVTIFNLDKMKINGCKGCFGGNNCKDYPCVQKDDMEKIYPVVQDADIVVLASPLYYWNISGQLKTALDRLFALEEGEKNFLRGNGKTGMLIMAAEGHGYEDVLPWFDHLMGHLNWNNGGHILAGGVMDIGDIKGNPEIEEAYGLGKSIH